MFIVVNVLIEACVHTRNCVLGDIASRNWKGCLECETWKGCKQKPYKELVNVDLEGLIQRLHQHAYNKGHQFRWSDEQDDLSSLPRRHCIKKLERMP